MASLKSAIGVATNPFAHVRYSSAQILLRFVHERFSLALTGLGCIWKRHHPCEAERACS